jgi:hypothetical protein
MNWPPQAKHPLAQQFSITVCVVFERKQAPPDVESGGSEQLINLDSEISTVDSVVIKRAPP